MRTTKPAEISSWLHLKQALYVSDARSALLVGVIAPAKRRCVPDAITVQTLNACARESSWMAHATRVAGIKPIGTALFVWHASVYNVRHEARDAVARPCCSTLTASPVGQTGIYQIQWIASSPNREVLSRGGGAKDFQSCDKGIRP
jgi:hypothetical protein